MNSKETVGTASDYFDHAAVVLFEANSSEDDEVIYKEVRLPVDIVQSVNDICDSSRRSKRNIKTGLVLHGFSKFLSLLSNNNSLYPFYAHDDIYRYFKRDWNCNGGDCIVRPSLTKRHVTYNPESIYMVRGRCGFSMSAKKAAAMEKVFRLLKLHITDGYAVCMIMSLYNIDDKYKSYILGDMNYLSNASDYIMQQIITDSRKYKQWISDCNLFVLNLRIQNTLDLYGESSGQPYLSRHRDRILGMIEGCRVAGKHMHAMGLYQMSTDILHMADSTVDDFNNIEKIRKSMFKEDFHVPQNGDSEKVVVVDGNIKFTDIDDCISTFNAENRTSIFNPTDCKTSTVQHDDEINLLRSALKAEIAENVENAINADDKSSKKSFFTRCRSAFNIIFNT
jgi:hypothetical protein